MRANPGSLSKDTLGPQRVLRRCCFVASCNAFRPGYGGREVRLAHSLPLAELEPLACALLPVLLAFLDAGVPREQAVGLKSLAQLHIKLQQRA